jgi:ribosomal protein S18 acetylase RimI-like enzyme
VPGGSVGLVGSARRVRARHRTRHGPSDGPVDAAYLSLLAVRPDLQARGVGRALLVAAVEAADAAGHPAVVLHALADNLPALRLYEAAGFRPTGVTFPHALTGRLTATYVVGMP